MDREVSVVVTERHGNRAASSGWMMRLVRQVFFVVARDTFEIPAFLQISIKRMM